MEPALTMAELTMRLPCSPEDSIRERWGSRGSAFDSPDYMIDFLQRINLLGKVIDPKDLKSLRKAIRGLPGEYKTELSGLELEEIAESVDTFSREYLIPKWLHLYIGSAEETTEQVVEELYRTYPGFKNYVEGKQQGFPKLGETICLEDEDTFQTWLLENSSYIGRKWGTIAWLGLASQEINWFYVWIKNLKYRPEGFTFIPFQVWYEGLQGPPRKIVVEVEVSPEDYIMVSKRLPSVAQMYSDYGGRVAVVQDSTLDIKKEQFLRAEEIAKLLQHPKKTIYNWASEGIIPCYRKDGKGVRFKWDEVRKWYSQYRQKGRTSRQFR